MHVSAELENAYAESYSNIDFHFMNQINDKYIMNHNLPDWLPEPHKPGSCHPGRLGTEVFDV
jgi:hypothetical protein